jgi:hypothetical protein
MKLNGLSFVIPERAEGASPETIITTSREYGFRARRFAAPRNDRHGDPW